MTLDEYLKQGKNSVVREKLINYKVFFEIKLAAARKQADINIYIPEIDKDGYDLVLDDGDIIKPFQLKGSNSSSKTSKWKIQKNLFRPNPINTQLLNYEQSPEGDGVEGGFILVNLKIKENDIETFEFFYTDVFILKAFELGLVRYNNSSYQSKIHNLISELHKGYRNEKVVVSKSQLVKVKSMDHLLALADLPSIYHNQWQSNFKNYLSDKIKNQLADNSKKDLLATLKQLIESKNLIFDIT